MSKKIKVCIIGAGNISNSRHIPALLTASRFEIVGVVSNDVEKICRTIKKFSFIKNKLVIKDKKNIEKELRGCKWFVNEVDAVVIGTPPHEHFSVVEACLKLGKHVLVEKPMMMNAEEAKTVMCIAKEQKKVLLVMHSFQFSMGMKELCDRYEMGELGEIKSILELQLSNRKRRLPNWYNELPLGLFYDEAAHFFYGARRFGGELKVLNAHARFNNPEDSTPRFLEIQMMSGSIPVQTYMNFNSPICEWGLLLIGSKKIAIYDYFKDILIVLDSDGEHYAKDVLRISLSFTLQFWRGFLKNGIKMLRGKLLYGHEECMKRFGEAIISGKICKELSGELGLEVIQAMNKVVELTNG